MHKVNNTILYNNIINNISKGLHMSLNEAMTLQEKIDAWHMGRRNQNVSAMSDDKLKKSYDICIKSGYATEARILAGEAQKRGIIFDTPIPTAQTKHTSLLSAVLNNLSNTNDDNMPALKHGNSEIYKNILQKKLSGLGEAFTDYINSRKYNDVYTIQESSCSSFDLWYIRTPMSEKGGSATTLFKFELSRNGDELIIYRETVKLFPSSNYLERLPYKTSNGRLSPEVKKFYDDVCTYLDEHAEIIRKTLEEYENVKNYPVKKLDDMFGGNLQYIISPKTNFPIACLNDNPLSYMKLITPKELKERDYKIADFVNFANTYDLPVNYIAHESDGFDVVFCVGRLAKNNGSNEDDYVFINPYRDEQYTVGVPEKTIIGQGSKTKRMEKFMPERLSKAKKLKIHFDKLSDYIKKLI